MVDGEAVVGFGMAVVEIGIGVLVVIVDHGFEVVVVRPGASQAACSGWRVGLVEPAEET